MNTSTIIAFIAMALLLFAIPIQARTVPTKAAVDASKNSVYRTSLVSPQSGSAGWRVSHGKIDIGWRPGSHPRIEEKPVLPGLSGIVKEKSALTLSEKAAIKHEKITRPAKYKSLVDALRESDSRNQKRR